MKLSPSKLARVPVHKKHCENFIDPCRLPMKQPDGRTAKQRYLEIRVLQRSSSYHTPGERGFDRLPIISCTHRYEHKEYGIRARNCAIPDTWSLTIVEEGILGPGSQRSKLHQHAKCRATSSHSSPPPCLGNRSEIRGHCGGPLLRRTGKRYQHSARSTCAIEDLEFTILASMPHIAYGIERMEPMLSQYWK